MYIFLIFTALCFNYCVHALLHFVSLRRIHSQTLPGEFIGLVSTEKFTRAQDYSRTNHLFSWVQESWGLIFFFLFLLVGGFPWLEKISSLPIFGQASEIRQGIVFLFSYGVVFWVASLPFEIYHTFGIEEKFGFNKTTLKTYLLDLGKGALLTLLIGMPILYGVLAFLEVFGKNSWWMVWIFLVVIQVLLLFIAPTWIMPLFNKFSPLPEGSLKTAIESLAKKVGFELSGIYSMDGSKRSAKANAFFTGFGRNRRIVLFDTLMQKHSERELVAILAHEIGHAKLKHILKTFVLSFFFLGFWCFLFSLLLNNTKLTEVFALARPSAASTLIIASILFQPLSLVLSLLSLALSRKHEFEADAYAATATGNAEDLISGLKKLSVDLLSDLDPHPLNVFFSYSHPPVVKRISVLRAR